MEQSQDAQDRFQSIVRRYADTPEVSMGKMFGSTGLKVHGKVFAMLVKDKLVVKLPKARVEELIALERGLLFNPGHGRLMKEWISVESSDDEKEWDQLVAAALTFVSNGS